jgi:hypothetical protein
MRFDTLDFERINIAPRYKFINRLVKQGIDAITKDTPDVFYNAAVVNNKSENAFDKYSGKIIRRIIISPLGFRNPISDSSKKLLMTTANVMNAVHVNTRDWVISNNLFIKTGRELNPYLLSDNERFLRTLSFIQDARIEVIPISESEDSVDVRVVTQDVFSISGGAGAASLNRFDAHVSDANFLGMGHKIEVGGLYDTERDPAFGRRATYSINNMGGSFVNATAAYTQFNRSVFDGRFEEHAYYMQLDRPLISPYSSIAGGLYFGHRLSRMHYARPEAEFYNYRNNTFDAWAGVNIGSRKLLQSRYIRDRRFLSARYVQSLYDQLPQQVGERYDGVFNNMYAALGQITFFRQDFYKTNYIYGFGVTEDIPYGYNIALIGGWTKQRKLERPYAGFKADRYVISSRGAFYRYFAKAGGYYNYDNKQLQDVTFILGSSIYSRLLYIRNYKMRQYVSFSYGRLAKQLTTDLLRIDNNLGLYNFSSPNIAGYQRLNFLSESSLFLNRRFLGFKFAPFIMLNAALLTPHKLKFDKSDIYTGIGGGIRTRNENLIFNTIELRCVYFPRVLDEQPAFRVMFNTNVRYRYNSNYITRPDFMRMNHDDG